MRFQSSRSLDLDVESNSQVGNDVRYSSRLYCRIREEVLSLKNLVPAVIYGQVLVRTEVSFGKVPWTFFEVCLCEKIAVLDYQHSMINEN